MHLLEIGRGVDWTGLAEDGDKWRAPMKAEKILRDP
jgi:hypothetical protein